MRDFECFCGEPCLHEAPSSLVTRPLFDFSLEHGPLCTGSFDSSLFVLTLGPCKLKVASVDKGSEIPPAVFWPFLPHLSWYDKRFGRATKLNVDRLSVFISRSMLPLMATRYYI